MIKITNIDFSSKTVGSIEVTYNNVRKLIIHSLTIYVH